MLNFCPFWCFLISKLVSWVASQHAQPWFFINMSGYLCCSPKGLPWLHCLVSSRIPTFYYQSTSTQLALLRNFLPDLWIVLRSNQKKQFTFLLTYFGQCFSLTETCRYEKSLCYFMTLPICSGCSFCWGHFFPLTQHPWLCLSHHQWNLLGLRTSFFQAAFQIPLPHPGRNSTDCWDITVTYKALVCLYDI